MSVKGAGEKAGLETGKRRDNERCNWQEEELKKRRWQRRKVPGSGAGGSRRKGKGICSRVRDISREQGRSIYTRRNLSARNKFAYFIEKLQQF